MYRKQVAPVISDFSYLENVAVSSNASDKQAQMAEALAIVAELRVIDGLLRDDGDAAALLLDGVLWRIVSFAFERAGVRAPSRALVFDALEELAPPLSWRLRLALRAPNVRARLIHAWALLEAVGAMPVGAGVSR